MVWSAEVGLVVAIIGIGVAVRLDFRAVVVVLVVIVFFLVAGRGNGLLA